jgi:hypothetical protein
VARCAGSGAAGDDDGPRWGGRRAAKLSQAANAEGGRAGGDGGGRRPGGGRQQPLKGVGDLATVFERESDVDVQRRKADAVRPVDRADDGAGGAGGAGGAVSGLRERAWPTRALAWPLPVQGDDVPLIAIPRCAPSPRCTAPTRCKGGAARA